MCSSAFFWEGVLRARGGGDSGAFGAATSVADGGHGVGGVMGTGGQLVRRLKSPFRMGAGVRLVETAPAMQQVHLLARCGEIGLAGELKSGDVAGGMLSPEELQRYSRQIRLPQIGAGGQERLRRARVLLLGLGGIGSPAALYLAAAGVGTLDVAEFDVVAEHNLQRQVLFGEGDVEKPKLDAGIAALRALNSNVRFVPHADGLSPESAIELFSQCDLVLDGTDNFATRYLANDAAHFARRPLIHASVFQFTSQLTVFDTAHEAPCLRCIFPEPPAADSVPDCGEAGVIGALCGVAGAWAAMEAIKILTNAGNPLRGQILLFDMLAANTRSVRLARNPACPLCGATPSIREIIPQNYARGVCKTVDPNANSAASFGGEEISVNDAARLLAGPVPPLVLDVREPHELAFGAIPNCHNIPLRDLPASLARLPRDRDILVVCQKGMRSMRALRLLLENGFTRARSIRGGMSAWQQR